MDNRQLLTALNQLKDEINQQIPLASNRYEQVETCLPVVDASIRQETYRRLFAESVAFSQEIWIKQNQPQNVLAVLIVEHTVELFLHKKIVNIRQFVTHLPPAVFISIFIVDILQISKIRCMSYVILLKHQKNALYL